MSLMRNLFGPSQGTGVSLPGPLGNIANIVSKFQQFARNPFSILTGLNTNIPQEIGNNPEAMVNYLRNSGQMSEEQFNQFSQLANQIQPFLSKKF